MGIKDLTEKILEDYNDIFADIVNVLVFKGKQRIKPETLVNTGVHSQYKNDKNGVLHEQERDVAKYWMNGKVRIALCGLENQTAVEPKMPLRVFGYEGASYRGQLEEKSAVPVITLVLYFGNEHWRAEKHLKDLLDIPEGMEEYVNDLKINVFEIAWLTDEQISMFKSDMCEVAERLEQMGIEKGRLEGEQMTVYSFVQDKTITPEQGAHKLNISVAELEKKMKEAGYTYPVF
ncbi:Rpn family recombination-promoting nuclease/putative transposase [Lachnospira pectinoschiza]|uniref:Rpn family recombination-promoting nuclease/putative transposase n=1 Tax=Lachnospira pectinoschiza TaxID=28052 RepID=UPI001D07833F|nr:Rpn family recombination-promoting nuclease/putative transposase [Lachnospira pectinoschiza]MCB6141677.1 Rpn family recombination-promoting nuclease/putative transposase [Lachnospira pectinoschiza]